MCVSIEPGSTSSKLRIQLSSTFCLEDARKIDVVLFSAAPDADVDLDFREVGDCDGPALAHLVEMIGSGRARVALHGMSRHVSRLFEYLGSENRTPGGPTAQHA